MLLGMSLFWQPSWGMERVATAMLLIANVINHPHFAHSYQIFYQNFGGRAFGRHFSTALRLRYLFAGVVVPLWLIFFFAYCLWFHDLILLGYAANLMFFLVGWHYVKQGFGMLMLDAALKQNYFSQRERKFLLLNGYLVWLMSWVLYNKVFANQSYWNIKYITFVVPSGLFQALVIATIAGGVGLLFLFLRKYVLNRSGMIPYSGLVAYMVSLYLWLLLTSPVMLLIIPAFHSLQYLAVVWRFKLNGERDLRMSAKPYIFSGKGLGVRLSFFALCGFMLGYIGFWAIPEALSDLFPVQSDGYGGALFLFIFWVFINIHHFFLDNVIWRKDNPDTRRYLFGVA